MVADMLIVVTIVIIVTISGRRCPASHSSTFFSCYYGVEILVKMAAITSIAAWVRSPSASIYFGLASTPTFALASLAMCDFPPIPWILFDVMITSRKAADFSFPHSALSGTALSPFLLVNIFPPVNLMRISIIINKVTARVLICAIVVVAPMIIYRAIAASEDDISVRYNMRIRHTDILTIYVDIS